MKLKVNKEKISVLGGIKTIYSNSNSTSRCIISIDIDGFVMLEDFKKIKDYTADKIVMETKQKNVYIYGNKLEMLCCNKRTAAIKGDIQKIEILGKEV